MPRLRTASSPQRGADEEFDAALASAPHVFREPSPAPVSPLSRLSHGAYLANPTMPGWKVFTLSTSTQIPATSYEIEVARCSSFSDTQLRVIAPDVGGSFGMKASLSGGDHCRRVGATAAPTREVGRRRQDDFLGSSRARDMRFTVEIEIQADGALVAVRLERRCQYRRLSGHSFWQQHRSGRRAADLSGSLPLPPLRLSHAGGDDPYLPLRSLSRGRCPGRLFRARRNDGPCGACSRAGPGLHSQAEPAAASRLPVRHRGWDPL